MQQLNSTLAARSRQRHCSNPG